MRVSWILMPGTWRCHRDGQRQALEQRKIDMHVQGTGLKGGEAVGDGQEFLRTAAR